MAQTKEEKKREKEEQFIRDVAAVFDTHGSAAGRFALAKIDKKSARASSGRKKCVKWGIDPRTNKKVCLKWV